MPGTVMQPPPPLNWAPGEFTFFFFYMGQGDCCIIVCPNQELIMVDCGSSKNLPERTPEDIRSIVRHYSIGGNTINHLILTHPDIDHYCTFGDVFNPDQFGNTLQVNNVFFSVGGKADNPLGPYSTVRKDSTKSLLLNTIKPNSLVQMNINRTAGSENNVVMWNRNGGSENTYGAPETLIVPESYLTIVEGSSPNPWSVKVVASNVKNPNNTRKPSPSNTASVCTLFCNGSNRTMLVGDATNNTTNYLLDLEEVKALISDLQITNISHHGSDNNSSNMAYIDVINPQNAIDSVQNNETGYKLPRMEVNARFLANMMYEGVPESPSTHNYTGWVRDNKRDYTTTNGKVVNYATLLMETYPEQWKQYKESKSVYIYDGPNPSEADYILIEPSTGFMLRQKKTGLPLQPTGQPGFNPTVYRMAYQP